ncbi:MAG: undecaprenyl-diphosphate phosphatase [Chromatiales bacterium]|jgi:undecaprenyl-diphosphatase|nr:MAG: undecaprenyl-diphosphate phosphatase [Chromatiales bacterium]
MFSAIVLAIVQGLTEFWPISSSAHLILVPRFMGWADQGLAFDVALHFGTLLAVMVYFRREMLAVPHAMLLQVFGRPHSVADARLGWAVALATVPAGIAGLLFKDFVEAQLRWPLLIAGTTAFYGVLLWVADSRRGVVSDERELTLGKALVVGCAQALALIPGTSRSGITITASLFLGLSREAATRFSFLMSIPVILLASLLEGYHLATTTAPVAWDLLGVGVLVAALTAYFCIAVMLRVVGRIGMAPFAIYRLLLATALLLTFS